MNKPFPIEILRRSELEELQNKRLRYTLRKAYEHTLFWHEKFDSLGIKPDDIKNKEDLLKAYKKGLEVTREDLIKNFDKLLPDYVKNNEVTYILLWTSGFGGVPKRIVYTYPFSHSNDVVCLSYNACTLRNGSRFLNLTAPAPYSSGILSTEAVNNYVYKIAHQPIWTPIPSNLMIPIFQSFKPTHLAGLPTRIFTLGRDMKRMGIQPSSFGIEAILMGGESCTKERKREIEEDWGAEVFDGIGTTECSYFAYECHKHNGVHVAETRVLFSVVDPTTKEYLGEGEEGKDLITNLYEVNEKPGMFLINYSHGDLTKILDEERCECGRTFLKVDQPKREDEIINIGGVKLYAREIERSKMIDDYISVLKYHRDSGKYELEIRVVPKEEYISLGEYISLKDQIRSSIISLLLSSNPAACQILYQSGNVNIKLVEQERLYENLPIPPGKPRRLIKINV